MSEEYNYLNYSKEYWDYHKSQGRIPPPFMFDPAHIPPGVRYIKQLLAPAEDVEIDFWNGQIRAVDNNKAREESLKESFSNNSYIFNAYSICVEEHNGKYPVCDGFGRFGGYWDEQIRIAKLRGEKIYIPVWVFEFDNLVAKSEFRSFMNRSYTSQPTKNADVVYAVHKLVHDKDLEDEENTIRQSIRRHNPGINKTNITNIYNNVRRKLDSGEDPSKTRPMTTQKIRDLLEENKNTMSLEIDYSSLNGGIKHKNNFHPKSGEAVILRSGSSSSKILDYLHRDSNTIRNGYMNNNTKYTVVCGLSNTSSKKNLNNFRIEIMRGINKFIDTESQWVKHNNGSKKQNEENFANMLNIKFVPQHSSEVVGKLIDGSDFLKTNNQ